MIPLPLTPIPAGAPKPGSTWRHYQGGVYEVLHIAQDTATGVLHVIYKPADGNSDRIWCRPLFEWRHLMLSNVQRFTEIA